jgi:hypothetical protein
MIPTGEQREVERAGAQRRERRRVRRDGGEVDPGVQQRRSARLLGDEGIGPLPAHGVRRERPVGGEEARGQGDRDPHEQPRVLGGVRPAVGGGPPDDAVGPAHAAGDGQGLGGRPEGGGRHPGARAVQPSERVLPEARVVVDAGHRQRVEQLHEQGADTPDDRGRLADDLPRRRAGTEQTRIARIAPRVERRGAERLGEPRPDDVADPGQPRLGVRAEAWQRRHAPMLPGGPDERRTRHVRSRP